MNKTQMQELLLAIKIYAFKSKKHPTMLYNIYGSSGHSKDRYLVDCMIVKYGFWKTAIKLILNKK